MPVAIRLEAKGHPMQFQIRETCPRCRKPVTVATVELHPTRNDRALQRSPDRQRSIERRRRLAASEPLLPQLASRFTTGELAVLRIVGDEVKAHGERARYSSMQLRLGRALAGPPLKTQCVRLVRSAWSLCRSAGGEDSLRSRTSCASSALMADVVRLGPNGSGFRFLNSTGGRSSKEGKR